MAPHPLIALAVDKETKQSKGFREVAARLNGEGLREAFDQERESAPRRADAGKRFFGVHPKKPPEASYRSTLACKNSVTYTLPAASMAKW